MKILARGTPASESRRIQMLAARTGNRNAEGKKRSSLGGNQSREHLEIGRVETGELEREAADPALGPGRWARCCRPLHTCHLEPGSWVTTSHDLTAPHRAAPTLALSC